MIIIEIFKLFGSILIDDKEANKSISKMDKNAKGLGERLGNGIKTAAKWGASLVAAAGVAGTAMFAMVNKATQAADAIGESASKMGISTDAYQEMSYWAEHNGISHGQFEKAIGRMNQRIGMAQNGNEKYAGALERLGVNLDDVRDGTISTEDAFTQSIKTLSEMENSHDQIALATDMFGVKLSRDLLPALQDGSLSMEEAKEKAHELGLVMSEEQINAAGDFQDAFDNIKESLGAFVTQIGLDLMPMFQTVLDWVMEHLPSIRETFSNVFGFIGNATSWVVEGIQNIIGWIQSWFTSNEETMNGIWTTIQEVFSTIVSFLQEAWTMIRTFWEENGQALLDNAITIFQSVWSTIQTAFHNIQSIIEQVLGYVIPWVQEKLKVLQKFWDENGQTIMQAVQNAFTFIQGVIEFVMPILTGIIRGAWEIISSIFDTVIGVIMGLVKTFSSLLTGDFEGIKDGLTDIWDSLWSGIKGIVSGAWSMLSGAFSGLWSNIRGWFGDLKDDALQWGKNMIQGFIDGIWSMGTKVADAASNVVSKAADFIKFWSPAKKGEGRFITHWGRNMVDGFLDGVRDETSEAGKVMNNLVSSMSPKTLQFDAMANVGSRGIANMIPNTGVMKNGHTINLNFDGANFNMNSDSDIKDISKQLAEELQFELMLRGEK